MPKARLLAAFAAGALVAVPGLAVAQGGSPFETPPVETPPVEVPSPDELEAEEEPTEEDAVETQQELEDEELEAQQELEDEGHGEVITALAACLPSGEALHGTGFNKGHVVSQAARAGRVVLEAHGVDEPVTSTEEATTVCALVTGIADLAEAPETAKGRPDWAGPKDGQARAGREGRGGPPPWAGQGGGPKGPR